MKNVKEELIRAGINNYTKHDLADNPVLCAEAIGYLKACKIIMPEHENVFDDMIRGYLELIRLSILE